MQVPIGSFANTIYSHFAVLLTALRCAIPLLPTFAADRDSTMTRLSDAGHSLRPDGQLRSNTERQLLFKWEVKSTSGSMLDAMEDLRGESGNQMQEALVPPSMGRLQQASLHVTALPCC